MAFDKSDNGAMMAGFTRQYLAGAADHDVHISVRADADLDARFVAFDHDNQEYISMNGWLWTFEEIVV